MHDLHAQIVADQQERGNEASWAAVKKYGIGIGAVATQPPKAATAPDR